MKLEILGSGTSHGVPVITCDCKVCTSTAPHDIRYRSSAWISDENTDFSVLIDCGPEFRLQALRANIKKLSAVLMTHAHADHAHGLDDLRIFCNQLSMPVYLNEPAFKQIKQQFAYVFRASKTKCAIPKFDLKKAIAGVPFKINEIEVTPIPLLHGKLETLGWRIGDTAYLTDCNHIPEKSYELLYGINNLVIDALRARKHVTHFSFSEALTEITKIGTKSAWFTHICHDYSHAEIKEFIKTEKMKNPKLADKKIEPAYDGLIIEISTK
ncbi:MAG: MBL fold metallo-hydrolase [Treponema sp.]|nr:MAG: MBL fold metallo-hydrolase [Treponema sp.]